MCVSIIYALECNGQRQRHVAISSGTQVNVYVPLQYNSSQPIRTYTGYLQMSDFSL